MKKTTCAHLRGPESCLVEITGVTAEEMGNNCRKHVMEMMEKKDPDHLAAVQSMQTLSKEDQMAWYKEFESNFDALENV